MSKVKPIKAYQESLLEWLSKSEKNQREYLRASVEENYDMPEAILSAIRNIAEVRGYEKLAKQAGLSQNALYKILDDTKVAKPRFDTIIQLLRALDLRIKLHPIKGAKAG